MWLPPPPKSKNCVLTFFLTLGFFFFLFFFFFWKVRIQVLNFCKVSFGKACILTFCLALNCASQFGLLRLWWTHRYTKFCEKTPQKAGTYVYHVNVRPPPPGFGPHPTSVWSPCIRQALIYRFSDDGLFWTWQLKKWKIRPVLGFIKTLLTFDLTIC